MLKTKKGKVATMGVAAIVLILTLAVIILNLGENSAAVAEIPDETPETLQGETAQIIQIETPQSTQKSTEKTPEVTTIPTENEPQIEEKPAETAVSPPVTTTTKVEATTPIQVDIPAENVEESEVVDIPQVTQTTPPPEMPAGAQGVDNHGNIYKIEGEQKYVWDPVLGWGEDNGAGVVTIMDVQSDGYKFFVESDGSLNHGKVVAPNGDVISYEEYEKIKESR